jgi:hypothetical protein
MGSRASHGLSPAGGGGPSEVNISLTEDVLKRWSTLAMEKDNNNNKSSANHEEMSLAGERGSEKPPPRSPQDDEIIITSFRGMEPTSSSSNGNREMNGDHEGVSRPRQQEGHHERGQHGKNNLAL